MITTGREARLGKHEPAIAMLRMVRKLRDMLEENELMSAADIIECDNAYYNFLATQPKKVAEEVLHG